MIEDTPQAGGPSASGPQSHAAYLADALLVSKINFNSGGAQAQLRNGWFINAAGEKIMQEMIFPADHPNNPDQPKGMKQVLMERGLCQPGLKKECKKPGCDSDATTCCATRILLLQPDFQEQKSLVQEIIEAGGHLCIFLLKFHCELNCSFGGLSRSTCESTVIIPIQGSGRIFQRLLPQLI